VPTRSLLGSDLLAHNPGLSEISSPYDVTKLVAVQALEPDAAFVAVQRADEEGGAHCWGALGVSVEACLASKNVVLVAEEIVSPEVISSDPNRVLTPPFRVSAVVHEPFACHPSPVQGHYARDHDAYHQYHDRTRTTEGFAAWLQDWVLGVAGRGEYLAKLGADRVVTLRARTPRLAAPVDYGD
jgi:glutaconate CoA-transferase subunit A